MFKAQFSYLDTMVLVAVGFAGGKWGVSSMAGAVVVGAIATVLVELAWNKWVPKRRKPTPCAGRRTICGDLTVCTCGEGWDTNDPHPPAGH